MPLPDGRIRLIIAGSRPPENIRKDPERNHKWHIKRQKNQLIWRAFQASPWRFFQVGEVVEGCADGIDRLAEWWAKGESIPLKHCPAQWKKEDGSVNMKAGRERNEQMAIYADALLAIWDGESKGTEHMIETMDMLGKDYHVSFLLLEG